ncbi:MAG: hypothetical protein WAT39_03845 [Planctomycetota bacterium]
MLAAGFLAAACGGSNVNNASPRVSTVPPQSTTGAAAFSLDLANYVSDREGATLTYTVTAGGGAFAGSVYSNTFPTMGEYTVEFTVADGLKTSTGSFTVAVTAANLAVVREDQSGILLLDTRSNQFVRVSGASAAPVFVAGLGDGRLVHGRQGGAGDQLHVFDPLTRTDTQLSAAATGDVQFEAKTSDNRIVYAVVGATDSTLHLFNPRTGVDRTIAAGASIDAIVNAQDLVFYEVGVGGQTDVYLYDSDDDAAQAVGTAATSEQLVGLLPNGGIVMSRIGAGGETDLFYFKRDVGLVEIGSDLPAIASANKTFHAAGTTSQVVFTAASGLTSEIHVWRPTNGQTTNLSAIVGAGAFDLFQAIGAGNEVVWNRVVSGAEADAYFHDLDSATTATIRNAADISQVLGLTGDGTTNWAIVRPSGATSNLLAVSLVPAPATQTLAGGGAMNAAIGTLANGDAVGARTDGTALSLFDVSAGTWSTPVAGAGLAFAGDGLDAGDFVFAATVGGQTDLSMWDASANTAVVVSNTAGNDQFQARTASGTLLFTRVTAVGAADLFAWNGTSATRLTDVDEAGLRHAYQVLGSYAGSR